MRQIYILFLTLFALQTSQAQIVNIPDANFKNALINTNCVDIDGNGLADENADTNNDGEIQISEAENIVYLIISGNNINSLEGIEYFINLKELWCSSNQLTSLNVSNLIYLDKLYCGNNQLTTINVSGLVYLERLYCPDNKLNSLDVTGLNNLEYLDISNNLFSSLNTLIGMPNSLKILDLNQNQLTEIDNISFSDNLFSLSFWGNQITEINTATLPTSLVELSCSNNPLTTLDVSPLVNLYLLAAGNCQLTSLEFGESPLPSFGELYCSNNNLTELDISNLTNLSYQLDCSNNQLTFLNLKNGALNIYEGEIYDSYTNFGGNPDLNYICADDFEIENMDYTVDEGGDIITVIVNGVEQMAYDYGYTNATVSSDCTLITNEFINIELDIFPNPVQDILTIKTQDVIKAVSIYDISGRMINTVVLIGNQNEIEINTSNLTQGTYFVKVKTERGVGIEKLIKE